MPRNGSGSYSRAVADYVFDTVISETDVNSEMDDIATALTASLAKDGQTTPTANLPMGTYRHTGVGNGSARTDYAAMGQVQDGKVNWVDGGGTADAITAAYSPAITALVDGQLCFVRATAANATTTPTFAPNGLTARTIVKVGGTALVAGEIAADGHELILRYDLANTRWELLNPAVQAASATAPGIVELATTAETETGTDATRAVTPDGLNDMTTLAGKAWFLDEDNMASDSAVKVASQQSIKAYVDAQVATKKNDMLLYQDQAASGTTGPTYTASGWRTVVLDTEVTDTGAIGSLSSNAVTLAAGSYEFDAVVNIGTMAAAGQARLRLQNTTDGSTVVQGVNHRLDATAPDCIVLHIHGSFVIAAQKTFELQVYPSQNTGACPALTSGEVEVYASFKARRYAA